MPHLPAALLLLLTGCVPKGDGGGDGVPPADADGDGWTAEQGDCDDGDAAVNPDEAEVWYDGLDQDCDGNDADQDGDGYSADQDCLDTDPQSFPGAPEVACDGLDQDCDGVDLVEGGVTGWTDADLDGYGDPASPQEGCFGLPEGTVANADDCDDTSADVSPAGVETCDGRDEDCDGTPDDGLEIPTWYPDADGDGFGDEGSPISACEAPKGAIAEAGDCNDTSADVSPAAPETCNAEDDDCDGETDETGPVLLYRDADGDGAGDPLEPHLGCAEGEGWVASAGDCDDADPEATHAEAEADNELDDDCDGLVDEVFLTAGSLVVSELALTPWVDEGAPMPAAQWFELTNPDPGRTVHLDGMVFATGEGESRAWFAVDPAAGLVLGPGERLVFCWADLWEASAAASLPLNCAYNWAENGLGGPEVWVEEAFLLSDAAGDLSVSAATELDHVAWDVDAGWPLEPRRSLSLDPAQAGLADEPSGWCATSVATAHTWWDDGAFTEYGTPGAENAACD